MQNISRVMENATSVGHGHRYVQELDLNFASDTLIGIVSLVPPAGGTAVSRPEGFEVIFNATSEQYNGTTALINNTNSPINSGSGQTAITLQPTANIVRGNFRGTYDGNRKAISNLTLNSTAAASYSKGLFGTVGAPGAIRDLAMLDCILQNGSNNGGFTSVNNGTIRDVAFLTTAPTTATAPPITGTGNTGGITGANNGTIRNALYIARAPVPVGGQIAPITAVNNSPAPNSITNAFYLSGTSDYRGDETIDYNMREKPRRSSTRSATGLAACGVRRPYQRIEIRCFPRRRPDTRRIIRIRA
jgi:hypothetical protein